MDKKQVKTVLTGDFSGIDNFIENIIYPIFGEECFEKKDVPVELVNSESKDSADDAKVSSILNIGTINNIKSEDIELFDVTLKNTSDISRSRVKIQRLIRSALSQYSHAFIVFHYKDCENKEWRFSYLHKEDSLKSITSAKRYTYVFGKEHNPRTATERFEVLANSRKTDNDLVEAFSVEALSKEFFEKYEEHYNSFVEYLIVTPAMQKSFRSVVAKYDISEEEKNIPEIYKARYKPLRDYVKKMMGRLVFLYFVERKGWLNGDKRYLTKLFNESKKQDDFLDKVLEPLFFGILNTPKKMRMEKFREMGWNPELIPGIASIPYLNGGLFEQDSLDKCDAKFPKDYFEKLFAFFSEYNFTVDENDPNDEEMGIDPEMLSVIFESLLEDNKGKGIFYTPKEVVQSMCSEALIAYLTEKTGISETAIRMLVENTDAVANDFPEEIQNNKARIVQYLVNIRVCDPAIGSGAFPMGMLNLLVKIRLALCPDKTSNEILELKRNIIQNNIYGVDIEKGAIDIARLRFWLSVVVDCKSDCDGVDPLPNLDYKFMQGNSLIPTFNGEYVNLSIYNSKVAKGSSIAVGLIVKRNLEQLAELKKDFFNLFGKDKYRKEIEIKNLTLDTLKEIFNADLRSLKETCPQSNTFFNEISTTVQRKIDENKEQQKKVKNVLNQIENVRLGLNNAGLSLEDRAKTDICFFDWNLCFSEVMNKGGFDIEIGNPPYIKEYINKSAFDGFRESSPYYMGKMDIWYGFACQGLDLLDDNGILCFIAQNNWTTSAGAKLMRKKVALDAKILMLMDFYSYMVFENADIQTMVMLFKKTKEPAVYRFENRVLKSGAEKKDMLALLKRNANEKAKYGTPNFNRVERAKGLFTFSEDESIFEKIAQNKVYLQASEATNGIHTHHDCVSKKIHQNFPDLPIGKGIFVLTEKERQELNLPANEKTLLKPFYTSEQIFRYWSNKENTLWIIYTDSEYKNESKMQDFPVLKQHLDSVKKCITSDNKPYGLHRAREQRFFTGEKIVSQRKCVERPCFSFNDFDCYVPAMYYVIQTNRWNMKFLTGVLNSKLVAFWLKNKGKMQGENFQVDKEPLLGIPLPSVSEQEQQPIVQLVDKILDKTNGDSNADISDIEEQIDELVFELYDLNKSQREIVLHGI